MYYKYDTGVKIPLYLNITYNIEVFGIIIRNKKILNLIKNSPFLYISSGESCLFREEKFIKSGKKIWEDYKMKKKWRKIQESKYFFTVTCLSFIFLLTGILVLIPNGENKEEFQTLWDQGKQAIEQENYVDAVQKLQEAVLGIGNTVGEQEFKLVRELAGTQVKADLQEEAAETYTRLINAGENTAELYMKRGFLYDQTGEYSKALEDYQNAVKAEPYNRNVYETIAQQLEVQQHSNEAEIFRETAKKFLGES